MNRYKPVGWRYESHRHSLASKGIKSRKITFKAHDYIEFNQNKKWYSVKVDDKKEADVVSKLPLLKVMKKYKGKIDVANSEKKLHFGPTKSMAGKSQEDLYSNIRVKNTLEVNQRIRDFDVELKKLGVPSSEIEAMPLDLKRRIVIGVPLDNESIPLIPKNYRIKLAKYAIKLEFDTREGALKKFRLNEDDIEKNFSMAGKMKEIAPCVKWLKNLDHYPSDSEVHDWAERNNMDVHQVEAEIYKLAKDHVDMAGKRSSFMPLPEDTEDWLRGSLTQRNWSKKDINDYIVAFKAEDNEKQKEIVGRQKKMIDAQKKYGGGAYKVAVAGKN